MKPLFATLIFSLTALTLPVDSAEGEPYAYFQKLIGEASATDLGVVKMTPDIFRHTEDGFSDLRLMSKMEEGWSEVSYLVVPREEQAKSAAKLIPSRVTQFEERDDESIKTTLKLGQSEQAAVLRIETPLRDFEKNVRVEGSDDGESWEPLVDSALIFDYRRFLDFRRTEIELPQNEFQYFRVTVDAATDQQRSLAMTLRETVSDQSGRALENARVIEERLFKIERFTFLTAATEADDSGSTMAFPVELEEVIQNPEEKMTEILLGVGRAPLEELIVSTEDTNFRRDVELQVFRGGEWRTRTRETIHRYEIGDFRDEDLSVAVRMNSERADQYRMLIHQGDSTPVTVSGVEGVGTIHEVIFVGGSRNDLTLFFGGGEISKPSYDVAAIRAGLRRNAELKRFESGVLIENPLFAQPDPPFPWQEQKWLLWVVVSLVVAGLGWILIGSAEQVEEIS